MDKMDFFSYDDSIDYDEIEELKQKALKRLQVLKYAVEHFSFLDELTEDEKCFYLVSQIWWFGGKTVRPLTNKQKLVVFYYLVQDFSVQEISIHLNTDKSSVYRILKRAFAKSKSIFEHLYRNKKWRIECYIVRAV